MGAKYVRISAINQARKYSISPGRISVKHGQSHIFSYLIGKSWVICGLLLLENHGPKGFREKNIQNLDSMDQDVTQNEN